MKSVRHLRCGPTITVQISRPGPSKWWEWSSMEGKWRSLGRLSLVHITMQTHSPEEASEAALRVIQGSHGHLLVVWETAQNNSIMWGVAQSDDDAFAGGVTSPPPWLKMPKTVWDRLLESEPPDGLP